MTSVGLSELKEIVEGNMKKELGIMEILLTMDVDSVRPHKWSLFHLERNIIP
jgi:hypothetical protein